MAKTDFLRGTSVDTAVGLTMQALGIIAAGWPVLYVKPSPLAGGQGQFDVDAMVRDAVDLAAVVQRAATERVWGPPRGVENDPE